MRSAAVCAVLAVLCCFDRQATSDPIPVLCENQRPGNPDWEVTNPAANGEIEGYVSATSINRGEIIDL